MWYIYIAGDKGERFNAVVGVIQFLTEALTKAQLLLAKIKSLICDVFPDSHLIGGRQNRTINPQELISPLKWSDFSVM